MKKALRITLKVISSIVILMIVIPIVLGIVLQIPTIQTFAVDKVTESLSKKTGTTFSISKVGIDFFSKIRVEGAYVEDFAGDTLAYVDEIVVGIDGINFFTGNVCLGKVELNNGQLNLYTDTDQVMNLNKVLEKFKSQKDKEKKESKFQMKAREVTLNNFSFTMQNAGALPKAHGINFQNLYLKDINFSAQDISIKGDDIRGRLEHISCKDHSGLTLQRLHSPFFTVNSSGIRLDHLDIITPDSKVDFKHAYLLYDDWSSLSDFVNKVTVFVEIDPSSVNYRTISYFMAQPNQIASTVRLSGKMYGPISKLYGKLDQVSIKNSRLAADFTVNGLPNINNAYFTLNLRNLLTRGSDITGLYSDFTGKQLGGAGPILERQGQIELKGAFQGMISNFYAAATLNTDLGGLKASLNVKPGTESSPTNMRGEVSSSGYDLGRVLASNKLGMIEWDAHVDVMFTEDQPIVFAQANIPLLQAMNYGYRDITIDGSFQGKTYEGAVEINDPNCKFDAYGIFNLLEDLPTYNFHMDLNYANLRALGFNSRDSVSVLSAHFDSEGSGKQLEDLNGELRVDRLIYANHIDSISAGKIKVNIQNSDSIKRIHMTSDLVDMDMVGTTSYKDFFKYIALAVNKYVPNYMEAEQLMETVGVPPTTPTILPADTTGFSEGYYHIKLDVKRANNVASIFVPGLQLATGTTLDFYIDPLKDRVGLALESDFIGTMDNYIYKLRMIGFNKADTLNFRVNSEEVDIGGMYIPNLAVRSTISNNRINLGVKFNNPHDNSMMDLKTNASFIRGENLLSQIKLEILESQMGIHAHSWKIKMPEAIIDTTGVKVNNFTLYDNDRILALNGKAGRNNGDKLTLHLQKFDLSLLSSLLGDMGYKIKGELNGDVNVYSLLRDLSLDANLDFDTLMLNEHYLGSPKLVSDWVPEKKMINFRMTNLQNQTPIHGYYSIPNKQYHVNVDFPHINLAVIEPLLNGALTSTRGSASASLVLSGVGAEGPSLDGEINISEYSFLVDFTKVRYSTSGIMQVKNSCFTAENLPINNSAGGGGRANFSLRSKYFNDIEFDLSARFGNLLVLNTSIADNNNFYGKAYASGSFDIHSDNIVTRMDVVASTAKSSEIYLPFTGVSSIEEANFITYVDKSSNVGKGNRTLFRSKEKIKYSNELDINVDLSVEQNTRAHINMVMNQLIMGGELMGNSIEANGKGRFTMHINPSQEIFTMNGNYEIARGKYLLKLFGNIFNKELNITPGSSLSWTGDPADPEFDVEAIYRVKTSLAPLSAEGGASGTTNIDCGIELTGRMSAPNTTFSIVAPSADPEKQNLLRNLLNTQEAINTQFFYLFLSGSFQPDASAASMSNVGSSLASATGAEFLSSQISNLISTDDIYIKLGYRPRTEYTSDIVNFGFETDIIPNKLMLELGGTYNTRNNNTYNQMSAFSADGYLTWVVNRAETIRLQAFTRVIERLDEMQGLQETGIGIGFRQDFNSIKELRQEYRDRRRMREIRREVQKRMKEESKNESDSTLKSSSDLYTQIRDSLGIAIENRN